MKIKVLQSGCWTENYFISKVSLDYKQVYAYTQVDLMSRHLSFRIIKY